MELLVPQESRFRHVCFEGNRPASAPKPSSRRLAPASPPRRSLPLIPINPHDARFLTWLLQQTGLEVRNYRLEALVRRIPACLRTLQARSVEEAQTRLERDPTLLSPAINAVLIGVTQFFRDPEVFSYLASRVLPRLLETRPWPCFWSAACSDGSEAYSLAILLAEAGALHRCQIVGSDCRPAAVERARAGRFPAEALVSLPEHLREKYFLSEGPEHQIVPALTRAIEWETADLFSDPPPPRCDLIFCRNMAIYCEAAAAAELWKRLAGALQPGGYLVTGRAETPGPSSGLVRLAPCLFRRAGGEA